ncbi:MAG: hypothetical protein ACQERS_04945 [Bacteroidota bacterium]
MKTQEELREEAKAKVDELTTKINSLRSSPLEDIVNKDKLDELIIELEKIRDRIKAQYLRIKEKEDKKWDEFELNVYQDMKSFNDAYRQAGTIFKSGKLPSR